MEKFVKRMVEEHAQLCVRIDKLHNYVYSEASDKDNKVEFANKAIQLAAMKKYEEALYARLNNQGVHMENGKYYEQVAEILSQTPPPAPSKPCGSDFDVDKDSKKDEEIDFGND